MRSKTLLVGDPALPTFNYPGENATLFPDPYGPAEIPSFSTGGGAFDIPLDAISSLIELVSVLGDSLASSSPLGAVVAATYLYTRWIQGKPLFKRGSKSRSQRKR